jgi:predicted transcriptional regulator of viral defense system
MASANKNIKVFLNNNSIFTLDELRKYFAFPEGSRKALDLIHEQKKYNRIGVIKSGLYFVVQPGNNPESVQVDPYLLSLKNVNNSIVAFHSAMELLGYSHSIFNITYSLSNRYRSSLKFRDQTIQYIMVSEILLKKSKEFFGTEKVERLGIKVTVTGKERTLVESLERPQYCGGFEEMYRSLERCHTLISTSCYNILICENKKIFSLESDTFWNSTEKILMLKKRYYYNWKKTYHLSHCIGIVLVKAE